jgi:hypothetical protein
MDMVFRDDECRIRKHNAPAEAHGQQSLAAGPGEDSLRVKRKMAAWDDDFLASPVVRN